MLAVELSTKYEMQIVSPISESEVLPKRLEASTWPGPSIRASYFQCMSLTALYKVLANSFIEAKAQAFLEVLK
jgi:hypothetical protein